MKYRSKIAVRLAASIVLSAASLGPALVPQVSAQESADVSSTDAVVAICSAENVTPESCEAAVSAYIAYLEDQGLSGDTLYAEIGTLVDALSTAVQGGVPAGVKAAIVAAVRVAANSVPAAQREQILAVAETLESGDFSDTGDTEDSIT